MKEFLLVKKNNEVFNFYENFFGFINNNEKQLMLNPKMIVDITKRIMNGEVVIEKITDVKGNEISFEFVMKNLIGEWDKRNGITVDDSEIKNKYELIKK